VVQLMPTQQPQALLQTQPSGQRQVLPAGSMTMTPQQPQIQQQQVKSAFCLSLLLIAGC